jgi:hypothetical protein
MFNYLEKLRRKSESEKKRFAFLTAFSFSGLIFVIWLSVIYPSWYKIQTKEDAAAELEPGPIDSLTGIISNGVSSITGTVDEAKVKMNSFSSSTPTSTTTQAEL